VQLLATRTKAAPSAFGTYRGRTVERIADGWYKYSLGPYRDLQQAIEARDEARRGSFKEAYIIALDGTKQITIDEAKKRMKSE
jgi:hypothetical protein